VFEDVTPDAGFELITGRCEEDGGVFVLFHNCMLRPRPAN
jgi:hypothetical protein